MKFLCDTKNIKEFKNISFTKQAAYAFFQGNEGKTSTFAFDLLKISYSLIIFTNNGISIAL